MTDTDKNFKLEKTLFYQSWEDNSSGCAEIIVLLELITVLEKKGRHINHGEINIGFDCKKEQRKVTTSMLKSNECSKEAGGEIAMIQKLMRNIKFNVNIKLVKEHEDQIGQCQS